MALFTSSVKTAWMHRLSDPTQLAYGINSKSYKYTEIIMSYSKFQLQS